jgi:hypothetical protein
MLLKLAPLAACTPLQFTAGVPASYRVAQHQPLGAGGTAGWRAQPTGTALRQLPCCCQLLLLRSLLRVLRKVRRPRLMGCWPAAGTQTRAVKVILLN